MTSFDLPRCPTVIGGGWVQWYAKLRVVAARCHAAVAHESVRAKVPGGNMVVETATHDVVVGADAIVDGANTTTSPRLDVVAVDRVVIAVGIVAV